MHFANINSSINDKTGSSNNLSCKFNKTFLDYCLNSYQRKKHMAYFTLPNLPYEKAALEPYISAGTLSLHHEKHHQAYINNLNNLIAEMPQFHSISLENVVTETYNRHEYTAVFNNAAQSWNHTFYWHSLKKDGGGAPTGELSNKINRDFGSYAEFKELFIKTGLGQFGSGWVWLILDDVTNKLEIMKTGNADLPMVRNKIALITADVWEHAYYLEYQNRRNAYLAVFLDKLVNWDFAERNFSIR